MARGRQRLVIYLPGSARERIQRIAAASGVSVSRLGAGLLLTALDDVVSEATGQSAAPPQTRGETPR